MKYLLLTLTGLWLLFGGYIQAANKMPEIQLRAETWDMPRHGERLIKIPELAKIVKFWSKQPQLHIELFYPGGEEGELWVEELKDWLVSLGVPSASILMAPGSGSEDIINIVLIEATKTNE